MTTRTALILKIAAAVAAGAGIVIGWVALETRHPADWFLPFHALVETFVAVVAGAVFTIAWNTRRQLAVGFFEVIGSACAAIALMHVLHMLTYGGMGIIAKENVNWPTQLWVSVRYITALAFVAGALTTRARLRMGWLVAGWLTLTAIILASIVFGWFPDAYLHGHQTLFKIVSEYVIIGLFALSIVLLALRRRDQDRKVLTLVIAAAAVSIPAELAFTGYKDIYHVWGVVGHLLLLASFFLVYKAFVETGIRQPYSLLLRDVQAHQRQLALSEQRYRLATEATGVGVWDFDLQEDSSRWSDRCREILGVEPDDKPTYELFLSRVHPDEREVVDAANQQALDPRTDGHYEMAYRLVWPDGSIHWVEAAGQTIFETIDGQRKATRYVGTVLDVTQEREAQQRLREANAKVTNILESITDAFMFLDRHWRFSYVNPSACDLLEKSPEQLLGSNIWELYPEAVELPFYEHYTRAMQQEKPDEFEAYYPPFGKWFEVKVYPSADGLGIYFNDRTDRHEAEEELRRIAQDLTRSNMELQQFAYVASHDLQEPLRMITGYLQLIERRYSEKLDDDASEFIGYAVDGAARMQQLIQDLLSFSRVGTRGHPHEPTELGQVLDEARQNLSTMIREHSATIEVGELPTVIGDKTQLVQLFQNLLSNAIKYRGDNPPHVRVWAQPDEEDERRWRISVSDNGIGIDPQYAEKIFVIFQRLHTRERYGGTGIGLAICKKIVERHGGSIWVQSAVGEGSTFHLTLGGTT
jgi:PAS domain S-box-containing protein